MFLRVARLLLQSVALFAAVQFAACKLFREVLSDASGAAGKGTARCLRTTLASVIGGGGGSGSRDEQSSLLGYGAAALAAVRATVSTAFHGKSYWTAAALLDVSALWAVFRRHKAVAAEAAASASLRRAAVDPANLATHAVQPAAAGTDLPLLRCAAVHAKAAYGAPAASGHVSSAAGYAALLTIHQATRKAPRRIPPALHLSGVHQLTGVPPADVLAAAWQSHLHKPAYYVAIDRSRRCVVVAVRGTLQVGDYCTVLDAVPQPATLCGVSGHVHGGFLAAAHYLLPPVSAALRTAATSCPGWPVLLTGHSLGGGVAAVLAVLLNEKRQQYQERQQRGSGNGSKQMAAEEDTDPLEGVEEEGQHAAEEGAEGEPLWRLGEMSCVGIGAAAAFCRVLGMACRQHVTSVLYGADCLPMFSVLGARLLIEEVHAKSKVASAVAALVRFARSARSGGQLLAAGEGGSLERSPSAASSSAATSQACELVCGGGGCRGLCLDSACELSEVGREGGGDCDSRRLQRCGSAWSSASTGSLAAFAADGRAGAAQGPVLPAMFPGGKLLWLLPPTPPTTGRQQSPQRPTLLETDQTAFERFLLTLETAVHHLPDCYQQALDSLAAA